MINRMTGESDEDHIPLRVNGITFAEGLERLERQTSTNSSEVEPPTMVQLERTVAYLKARTKCPECGSKVQALGKAHQFCLDCDWDNLEVLASAAPA